MATNKQLYFKTFKPEDVKLLKRDYDFLEEHESDVYIKYADLGDYLKIQQEKNYSSDFVFKVCDMLEAIRTLNTKDSRKIASFCNKNTKYGLIAEYMKKKEVDIEDLEYLEDYYLEFIYKDFASQNRKIVLDVATYLYPDDFKKISRKEKIKFDDLQDKSKLYDFVNNYLFEDITKDTNIKFNKNKLELEECCSLSYPDGKFKKTENGLIIIKSRAIFSLQDLEDLMQKRGYCTHYICTVNFSKRFPLVMDYRFKAIKTY